MATEVGKGYVGITADTNKLQTDLGAMGATLGGKFGVLGSLMGKQMGSGISNELGPASKGVGTLAGMLGDAGPWGIAAGAAVAAAAAVGVGLYKLGGDFESNYRTIARQTGATGTDLDHLKKAFNDVLKATPASMGQVSEAIIAIQRYTGPASSNLEGLSKQLITMSRITGTDVKTNTEAAVQAFERWNIPAREAPAALDAIFKASQKSGVSFNDLSGSVTKFAPQLATMGYSFNDSVSMIAAFGKEGVNTSRVMAAMQIAGSKFAKEGVKDIPEAMKATIGSIKNASSETDALNIATKLFGSRGAVQMVQAIRSGKFDFDAMTKAVNHSKGAIQDTAKATPTLQGSFGKLRNSAEVALQPLSSSLFKNINKGLISVMTNITPLIDNLATNMPQILSTIGKIAGPYIKVIGDMFGLITPAVKVFGDAIAIVADLFQGKWGAAFHSAGALLRGFGDLVKAFGKEILDLLLAPFRALGIDVPAALASFWAVIASIPGRVGSFLAGLWGSVWNAVTGAFGAAVNAAEVGISALWGWLSGIPGRVFGALAALGMFIWNAISTGFTTAVGAAEAGIVGIWGWLASIPSRFWAGLGALGGAIWGAISGGFSVAVGAAEAGIGAIWGWLGGIAGRVMGGLAAIGGAVWGALSGGFGQAVAGAEAGASGLWGFVSGVPGRIKGALGDVASLLYEAGKAIINSLGRGIKEAAEGVFNFVSGIAGKIASLKGPLDKDRRLLVPAGQAIMGGLHSALLDGMATVSKSVTDFTDSLGNTQGSPLGLSLGGAATASGGGVYGGPAVVIQNATFNDGADVEQFMRQAAWVVQTQRI